MTTYMFQPEIETMSSGDKERLQSDRLVSLLDRLRQAPSAYWRAKLSDVDIGSIASIRDIDRLPFTEKSDFRDMYPYGMLSISLDDTVRLHASSGTSGKPTVVGYSRGDIEIFAECNARALAIAGVIPGDVLHNAYGYGLFTGGLGLHFGGELLGATVVPASGGNTTFQLQLMEDLGAGALCATPSFCMLLGERAAEVGLHEHLSVRTAILGAEPWSEGMRHKLHELWGDGFQAVDIYGLSEVMGPGVAQESPESPGSLQIFDDHFYPEIVDPNTGEPVDDGEYGELVITTLTKEAQPVLRYRTRDITRILPDQGSDGRTFTRLARLTGRADDMLIIRGVNVYPREIEAVLLDDPDIGGQYAIVVDRRQAMAELRVVTELASPHSNAGAVMDRLQADLLERIRIRTTLDIRPPGGMPRQEVGKAQRVFEQTTDEDPIG